jgi:hypothetical protein
VLSLLMSRAVPFSKSSNSIRFQQVSISKEGKFSMNCSSAQRLMHAALFIMTIAVTAPFVHAEQWTAPTPEELSMTSQPQVPGAAAVYLYREEITEDDLHEFRIYTRLKVLTEGGKKYGDVELYYGSQRDEGGVTIGGIEGRTIHSDGTIIPFTGKPYKKLIEKSRGSKEMAEVFSMPDVQVGSIIEYRYAINYSDMFFIAPRWYIQSELFTRKAHYSWKPTTKELSSDRGTVHSIGWLPILPTGTQVKETTYPATSMKSQQVVFETNCENVPPSPDEDYMPPITSLTYRVLFYYSSYRSSEEFWKEEGKRWSKEQNKFIGPGKGVKAAVDQITSSSDSQDQKLRKIYAAVMQLDNTDFTRVHSTAEEKAEGFRNIHTTDDIWDRKRGNSDQLAELFVAMVRASGMKADLFAVTNRDRNIFLKAYLSLSQLDDYIAIVNVDGKEQFFDPGSRYCPYGHLNWKHSMTSGIRQTDGPTDFGISPLESYTTSSTQRVADLTMDPKGIVSGTVKMTYIGAPALSWRQRSLVGDATSLNDELRTNVEKLIPQGMDVKVVSIDNLTDYEKPLYATFQIIGPIGSATGKRLFYPGDIFEANSKAAFPNEKRDIPIYFEYPSSTLDAVRVKFPPNFNVESSPTDAKFMFKDLAAYNESSASAPGSVTIHRNYSLGTVLFMTNEYSDLRSFYSKMETKDQESVVLKAVPVKTTGAN